MIARVITELGTLQQVTPSDIEGLFAADLAFLQDLYGIVNFGDPADVPALQRAVLPESETELPPDDDDAFADLEDAAPSPAGNDVVRAPQARSDRGGRLQGGAMKLYPDDALWDEIVYLAYHLHWDLDALLDLGHSDRTRLVRGVAELNERAWEAVRSAQ